MLSCLACNWWRADAQAVQHIDREHSKEDKVLTAADHVVLHVCCNIDIELVQDSCSRLSGPSHDTDGAR